jgi:8-oxo-dGTP pyrophosphatase MutT (NUDIX family)
MAAAMNGAPDRRPTGIIAAGAIVRGTGTNDGKILVIRRDRYGPEIALPKGKKSAGEDELTTARREVLEETGCPGAVVGYAGSTHYLVGGVPKVVFFLIMQAENDGECRPRDTGEVRAVEWLDVADAIASLSHRNERDLIASVFPVPRSAVK